MIHISIPPRRARPYYSQKQFEPVKQETTRRLREWCNEQKAQEAARNSMERMVR